MRRTKEESEETKERIIEAALYIFLEKGFSETSIEDIVKPLNLTRGAFYWHFKDKDEVFKSIIQKEHSQRLESLNSIRFESPDEKTQLKQVMANIIDTFYDNERFRSFIKLRWFRVEQDPYKFSVPVTEEMNTATQSIIIGILESAEKKGMLAGGATPLEIKSHLIALTNGIFRLYFVLPEFYSVKENISNLISNYIDLLFKE
ncbi:MAG TPA: TetR/AcrR family transcriptional regulator [Ignavibacteria bacterium]|nr:TetR/AcrR family transcriptional regulator [Ignavibacteria bacterium]